LVTNAADYLDFALRMKTTKVVARSGNTASEIVLFYDRSPSYHQFHKTDIYAGQSGDYFASYCYLDGHADGRGYSHRRTGARDRFQSQGAACR